MAVTARKCDREKVPPVWQPEIGGPVPEPGAIRNPIILKGDVPSPINPPSGCRFHTRCPFVFDRCRAEEPELRSTEGGRGACHLKALPEQPGPAH